MGFFGDLLKKTAKNLVSDVVENVAGDLFDGRSSSQNTTSQSSSSASASNASKNSGKRGASGEVELRKRLEAEFAMNYSDCDVRQQISSSVVDAPAGAEPFHYGLYKAGEPVAFFMIITRTDHYAKSTVRKATAAAESQGIPCMNFYSHLPNTPEYIAERLAANIKR